MEPPTTAATRRTPKSSSRSFCSLLFGVNVVLCQPLFLLLSRVLRAFDTAQHSTGQHSTTQLDSPDIIPHRRQRKFRSIPPARLVPVAPRDGTRGAIGATQTVDAHDEEARDVERAAAGAHEGAPPVSDVGAAGQGVADDERVVGGAGRQAAARRVGDGHVAQRHARLERKGRDQRNVLRRDQRGKGILGLADEALCREDARVSGRLCDAGGGGGQRAVASALRYFMGGAAMVVCCGESCSCRIVVKCAERQPFASSYAPPSTLGGTAALPCSAHALPSHKFSAVFSKIEALPQAQERHVPAKTLTTARPASVATTSHVWLRRWKEVRDEAEQKVTVKEIVA